MSDSLLHSLEDGVLRITLNRPDQANAIDPDTRDRLIDLFTDANGNDEIRAVVIQSSGKHFCAGADVGRIAGSQSGSARVGTTMRRMFDGAQRLIGSVLDCGKPVVAVVQGGAAGLGAHLALACDLIVASEDAWFSSPLVNRGLVLDAGGAYLLPRRMGLQKAKELAFLGDRLSAADALALGIVNRLCPPAELAATGDALALRLTSAATTAVGLSKRLLNHSLDADRQAAFLAEAMAQEINSRTEDMTEGVTAFVGKRPAEFKGY
jgi:2-(1,2-epoxy-1,2-dihydrophenyl)acetyl-CoA isomerase